MATLHLRLHRGPDASDHARLRALSATFWSIAGSVVLLFIFFAAMGAIDPSEAVAATAVVAILGVLWLIHAWPRLRAEGGMPRDRERRGF